MGRVVRVIVAIMGAVFVVVAGLHFASMSTTPDLQVTAKDVRITECDLAGVAGSLRVTADVVNPSRSTANLIFGVRFYWVNEPVGSADLTASHVAPTAHVSVSSDAFVDLLDWEKLNSAPQTHLTCDIERYGSGTAVAQRG